MRDGERRELLEGRYLRVIIYQSNSPYLNFMHNHASHQKLQKCKNLVNKQTSIKKLIYGQRERESKMSGIDKENMSYRKNNKKNWLEQEREK